MELLTIGQLAKKANVNVETVRYYERRELLPEPRRTASGYRQYAPDAVDRLRFIKRGQELGFSLKEVAELLELRVEPGSACEDVRERTEEKIRDVEEKIRSLRAIRTALKRLVTACETRDPTGECPVLEALECR